MMPGRWRRCLQRLDFLMYVPAQENDRERQQDDCKNQRSNAAHPAVTPSTPAPRLKPWIHAH